MYESFGLSTIRDGLHNELEKLRDEQRYMENDLSNIQIRWHTLREEKVKAANTLRDVKKAEEELERLTEEKNQVDLDEKVVCPSKIFRDLIFHYPAFCLWTFLVLNVSYQLVGDSDLKLEPCFPPY